jgi:hypothetical protein
VCAVERFTPPEYFYYMDCADEIKNKPMIGTFLFSIKKTDKMINFMMNG